MQGEAPNFCIVTCWVKWSPGPQCYRGGSRIKHLPGSGGTNCQATEMWKLNGLTHCIQEKRIKKLTSRSARNWVHSQYIINNIRYDKLIKSFDHAWFKKCLLNCFTRVWGVLRWENLSSKISVTNRMELTLIGMKTSQTSLYYHALIAHALEVWNPERHGMDEVKLFLV